MQSHDWNLRRPAREELESVVDLMRAYDSALSGEPDTDLEDIQHDWRLIQLERDAWVAAASGQAILGYAAVLPGATGELRIDLVTAPDWIESKLPARLLAECLEHAAELSRQSTQPSIKQVLIYLLHSNQPYRVLLTDTGFAQRRIIYQLNKDLTQKPAKPDLPAGIRLRTFNPDLDSRSTYELVEEAFERPGRVRANFEQWAQHMIRPESYDPDLWYLAFDGEELVGVCLGFDYPTEGWVRQLAVQKDWRRRGLGSALLNHAFTVFYERGKPKVGLTTESDNQDALEFYERCGMTVRRQYDEYVRPIEASGSEPSHT